jgi:hypothetical protein
MYKAFDEGAMVVSIGVGPGWKQQLVERRMTLPESSSEFTLEGI